MNIYQTGKIFFKGILKEFCQEFKKKLADNKIEN